MLKKLPLAGCLLGVSAALVWVAACSSMDSSGGSNPDGGGGSSSSGGSGGGGGSSSGGGSSGGGSSGGHDGGGITDAAGEGGGVALLVDDMTAKTGTQIRLQVPAGDTPGSYYTYSDRSAAASNYLGMMSIVTGTSQLADAPVTPAVTNPDGSQIVGELCFGGRVVGYAGLGMNLVYGNAPDATPESGLSSPIPFDASRYSGISFYIRVDPNDATPLPSVHFGVPDTQTADPAAWPTSDCAKVDGGVCDDDFGADVTFAAGQWTKVAFQWSDLTTQGFGMPSLVNGSIRKDQLIGMKWQANGAGVDAAIDSFNFCISDIYFTP